MTTFDEDLFKWSIEQSKFIKKKQWDKVDHIYVSSVVRCYGDDIHYKFEKYVISWLNFMLRISFYNKAIHSIERYKPKLTKLTKNMEWLIKCAPSLRSEVEETLQELYDTVKEFKNKEFPKECPWTIDEILDTKQGE